jgi:hypothetical protein
LLVAIASGAPSIAISRIIDDVCSALRQPSSESTYITITITTDRFDARELQGPAILVELFWSHLLP